MKHVLSALIILSLLGVGASAANEPYVVDGSTALQRLGEIRLETVTVEGIEDAYSELEDLVAEMVEFVHPDGDAMRALRELHTIAEHNRETWMLRCEASSAERECARVQIWDERLSRVRVQIDTYRFLKAECTETLELILQDKELALHRFALGDRAEVIATLQNSISTVQDLLERIETAQSEIVRQ